MNCDLKCNINECFPYSSNNEAQTIWIPPVASVISSLPLDTAETKVAYLSSAVGLQLDGKCLAEVTIKHSML